MNDSQPRWLDAEEQQTWVTLAHVMLRLPAALDTQMQRDAGITHFEYLVLYTLDYAPERAMRMSELAQFTASSLSRLSNVVTRLEKRGWLRRAPDPAGRHTLAILTDEGSAEVQAYRPGHVDEVRRLVFDPLTRAQQRQLREIGRRILRAIDPGGDTSGD
ncbi:MarR family transcriptional regulator [Streptacidiphilus sp. N1-10]|uniref:MarR family transcriptional regulator n=1 Tax=Streptacidiphilus jeojiensis TaxID=3229225 RepID=A0ABV6XVV0_9ACTN